MAEVPFRPVRQLSEYKGKGASASREAKFQLQFQIVQLQSALNDDYNNVSGNNQTCIIFQSQKLEDFFSKTCDTLFTFEQFSLIHSPLQ